MRPGREWEDLCRQVTRRELFRTSGLSLGAMALACLLQEDAAGSVGSQQAVVGSRHAQRAPAVGSGAGSPNPQSAIRNPQSKAPHFAPRARRVIYLHMIGAPSQLDLFDYKPALVKHDGQACPEELTRGRRFAFIGGEMTLAGTRFGFGRHGQSGQEFSELLPHLAGVADELCVVRSLQTEEINHAPAQMFLHSGFGRGGRPGLGSWVVYGLGSETQDLPAYVVLLSGPAGGAGASLWSSGFLPSVYQGTLFRSSGDPVLFLSSPRGHRAGSRRRLLDAVQELNRVQLAGAADPEIATRIRQYELAFRMQASVPELMDLSKEDAKTLALYGAEPGKASFANNCLLARRLVERGVRMVQLYDADWDHHNSLDRSLPAKCRQVDRPMAALITDLKQRGLLDDTLVVWGSEFGRTPLRQGNLNGGGRDHHKDAYTCWLAGGGVRPGLAYGKTDELGFNAAENPVHVHDLNATILHLLGINHERLTYRYQGRDFRLTDVHGRVVREILL
jgi:uncharacterized protein DUF1501